MQDYSRFFGAGLAALRLRRNISQWTLAVRIPYHIRNIQRIEKGLSQPGVSLALKLLQALDVRPGDFLSALAEEHAGELPSRVSTLPEVSVHYIKPAPDTGRKSIFGLMLNQARVATGVSQTTMASAAAYSLRNINYVEKGRQEPGIMTALALVMALGVNTGVFFNELYGFWLDLLPD